MTQVFDEQGAVVPVTVIQAGPCYVTQVRNAERDGYVSVQLGFGETKPKNLTKGQLGHLQRLGLAGPAAICANFALSEARRRRGPGNQSGHF